MNRSCLLLLCILSGVRATEISCVRCVGENQKKCQGTAQKCPLPTDECISVLEVTKMGSSETSVFMRLCGNCSEYVTGNVRFDKGILKVNATCCGENNCTPLTPTIPPDKPGSKDEKRKVTELRCRSCFAKFKTCDCNTFVNCSIGETKCISRHISATVFSKGGFSHVATLRGCTTKEMCKVHNKTVTFEVTQVKTEVKCSDEGDGIHNSLSRLVLAAAVFFTVTTAT